jgi:hypothetical protein
MTPAMSNLPNYSNKQIGTGNLSTGIEEAVSEELLVNRAKIKVLVCEHIVFAKYGGDSY